MLFTRRKTEMVDPDNALAGRDEPLRVTDRHAVLGTPIKPPFGAGIEVAYFGLGCFWGAERVFWQTDGVYSTAVGYQGGVTPNPSYEEVCSAKTGHTEAVMVAYDPSKVTYEQLLKAFWEGHDPTQGMRQGNDVGTQYRSAIYTTTDAQLTAARASAQAYGKALADAHRGEITTEIAAAGPFYYAEDHHQQYLHKVPNGYCGLGGTGVSCPIGVGVQAA